MSPLSYNRNVDKFDKKKKENLSKIRLKVVEHMTVYYIIYT